jgi:hypothetical protein
MPFPPSLRNRMIALLAIVAACLISAQAQDWKGRIVKEGDITVVQNPKDPIHSGPVLGLKEDWTIGGKSKAGDQALAKPWCIAVDEEGLLYVLDVQDACVKVFDGTGTYVRAIGRRGQGPGEIGAAFSIMIPEKSKILIFNDVGGRRLAFFSLGGMFQKNLPVRGLFDDPIIDSHFDIYVNSTDIRNRRESLKKMNPDMTAVLAEIFDQPSDESHNPFKARTRWILDTEDHFILGRATSYEFDFFDNRGVLSRKIRRDYDPQKVSKADVDEFLKRGAPPGVNPTYDFSTHHAYYRSFFVDDMGHLFVQTWERNAGNTQDVHDVFDSLGRFVGRIAMPRHEDLINPTIRVLKKGKFYAIEPDDEGYNVVKRYSVTWLISVEKGG